MNFIVKTSIRADIWTDLDSLSLVASKRTLQVIRGKLYFSTCHMIDVFPTASNFHSATAGIIAGKVKVIDRLPTTPILNGTRQLTHHCLHAVRCDIYRADER